jgi:cold shock CspA family protein
MPQKAEAARLIAKLLANRETPVQEIPALIEAVQRTLSNIANKTATPPQAEAHDAPAKAIVRKRAAVAHEVKPAPEPAIEASIPSAAPIHVQPTLLRRAEVITVAPVTLAPTFAPQPGAAVRGVVQWFDTRTGRGALRLQGLGNDLAVEAATLSAFGIGRLFKGQEVEAALDNAGDPPKVLSLHLVNAPSSSLASGGMVRDRHAKQVVVELKREAQSRSAAWAEAELLMRPQRSS